MADTNGGDPLQSHEATAAAIQALSATSIVTHPLQEVNLFVDDELIEQNVPETKTKKNWVKFDDEVNEIGTENNNNNNVSSSSVGGGINDSNNKGISVVDGENAIRRGAAAAAVADLTTTSTSTSSVNKLSPILLPPPAKQHQTTSGHTATRPRTPTERQQSSAIAAAPVQRTTVSSATLMPDVAPAVLTTESTHVNLNASGKAQQLLQHHPQQHQQQPKSKAASPATATATATTASSQHTQLSSSHHHPHVPHHQTNNGVTPAAAGSGAITTKMSMSSPSSVSIPVETATPSSSAASASAGGMRTIELSTGRIREGFANGDVIVTLLPANSKWPWVTPAIFRPELVPEELMAQGLTLTVEEYVNAMETLVNDYRFTVYNICYKRILVCWILFAFTVLLALLFSGLQGVALFSLGVCWLFLNAAAIFLCMWVKLRLARGLEKCLARVNKQLMKHKILLVLDDRGRISCHKVNLCFLYFDATQCVNFLNEFLEHTEQNGGEAIKAGWESKLDIDLNDIVIQGNNPVRLSRKQAVAQEIFLSYLQRWGKDFLRRRLDWTVQEAGVHETPRHLQSSICPCQYEEEVLRNKIKLHLQRKQCCGINCLGCWL